MSHGRNKSLFIGGFLLNLVAESPKGREVPQGEAFELGRSVPPSIKLEINCIREEKFTERTKCSTGRERMGSSMSGSLGSTTAGLNHVSWAICLTHASRMTFSWKRE